VAKRKPGREHKRLRAAFKKFAAKHKLPARGWNARVRGRHRNMSISSIEHWENLGPYPNPIP